MSVSSLSQPHPSAGKRETALANCMSAGARIWASGLSTSGRRHHCLRLPLLPLPRGSAGQSESDGGDGIDGRCRPYGGCFAAGEAFGVR